MAAYAWRTLHQSQFGIIFDTQYRFGVEGAYAFDQAYKRLSGHDIPGYYNPLTSAGGCSKRFCGISSGKTDYSTENHQFNQACFFAGTEKGCDFVSLLLEPTPALTFLREGLNSTPTLSMAQPLFTQQFASQCGHTCDAGLVWTGYNPPIGAQLQSLPAVKAYQTAVKQENSNADIDNQFTEGGYAGMKLLIDALRRVGPDVTRLRLKAVLDSMTRYSSGLTTPLTWSAGHHYANTSMRAFAIQNKGNFNGWTSVTGWIRDPWVGQDTGD
jgi:hypothetical protein